MKTLSTLLFVLSIQAATAAEIPGAYRFDEVWRLVRKNSPALDAKTAAFEVSQAQANRSSRHWYPKLFAEGKVFSTNDPSLTFFSQLSQRQVGSADFVPQTLNNPGSSIFQRATLGLDLPIYEGGVKESMKLASLHQAESKSLDLEAQISDEYARLAVAYGGLLVSKLQTKSLNELAQLLDQLLARYRIGSQNNPVGYSGLLGLKTLRKRVEATLVGVNAQYENFKDGISIQAGNLKSDWSPVDQDPEAFVKEKLPKVDQQQAAQVLAMKSLAAGVEESITAERARFLPMIGLFSTGDLNAGQRGMGTSYTAGAYLRWNLFDATNLGAVDQAAAQARAVERQARSMEINLQASRLAALRNIAALEHQLRITRESVELFKEQARTSSRLFLNGSISALQLVEVLARQADLTNLRADQEHQYLAAHSLMYTTQGNNDGSEKR